MEVPPAAPVQFPALVEDRPVGLVWRQGCSQMVTPEIKEGGAARAPALPLESKSVALL